MNKLLLSLFFLLAVPADKLTTAQETYVYICTGPQSKRYHKTNSCRGLNKCSGDVLKVTITKAKSMNRTACGWCYK